MIRAAITETRVFESWQDYQEALKGAIAPLTDEQLQRRPIPGYAPLEKSPNILSLDVLCISIAH